MTGTDIVVIRSKRKSVSIEVDSSLKVKVRVPLRFPEDRIPEIIREHSLWIEKAIQKRKMKNLAHPEPTPEESTELIKKAREILPGKIAYYSELTGLRPTGIKITGARTRFGSCSGKNSICFSYYLMQYPDECIDYVVLHEIAHIKHHNHSKNFYSFIEKYMPDYRVRAEKLKY